MVRWRDAAVCLAAQENRGERKIWFVMQADLAVVWEIPVCVSHLYYFMSRSVKKKKKGNNSPFTDTVDSCTALMGMELGFPEKGKC